MNFEQQGEGPQTALVHGSGTELRSMVTLLLAPATALGLGWCAVDWDEISCCMCAVPCVLAHNYCSANHLPGTEETSV